MSYFQTSGAVPTSSGTGIVIQPTGTVMSQFSTVTGVATSATVTILTYTVPASTETYLLRIEASGTNIATYDILIDGQPWARTRTYFSGPFVAVLHIGSSPSDAIPLNAGQVVDIQVTNFRPTSGNFEARLQFIQV